MDAVFRDVALKTGTNGIQMRRINRGERCMRVIAIVVKIKVITEGVRQKFANNVAFRIEGWLLSELMFFWIHILIFFVQPRT